MKNRLPNFGIGIDEKAIDFALDEDIGKGDVTSDTLFPPGQRAKAIITCKEDCVLAGVAEAVYAFDKMGATVTQLSNDGDRVSKGTRILEIDGPARNVLAAERTALNILSRMSGIATATSRISKKIPVAATRKSPVGSQLMDKKAIALGGGLTHRLGLWDMTLIKDTHLALVDSDRLKAIDKAVRAAKKPVEVEAETLEEALVAAKAGVDIVMLDNFSPESAKRAVAELRKVNPGIVIELSGGITDATIDTYAATGADFVSLGALTHSVKAIDFSMATFPA